MTEGLGTTSERCGIIYSRKAPAIRASIPPDTRFATPALVVGTAIWEVSEGLALALGLVLALAEVETAVLELSVEVSVTEVLEAVVMVVGELELVLVLGVEVEVVSVV